MNRRTFLTTTTAALLGAGTIRAATVPRRAPGADLPWTTYLAQDMRMTGEVLGPVYAPARVEMESSRQRCVKLAKAGDYVEFTVKASANAMIVRYCLPDSPDGAGIDSTLDVYRNDALVTRLPITSRFAWLYGKYPFGNAPSDGAPRRFYDEVRCKDLVLAEGDVVRLCKPDDAAPYCIVDLVDLEQVPPPLAEPPQALCVRDFGAKGDGETDDTEALRACVAAAAAQGKTAFVPAGNYKLTGDIDLRDGTALQGAGMWHTTFVGDEALYGNPDRRLRFKVMGSRCRLADFALIGKLKCRNDQERNDGVFGAHAKDCEISRLWIEHTKVGMWFYVCQSVIIRGCRLRNTLADGINLCVDVRDSVIENCTARNTGDDCFAIWPTVSDQGFMQERPGPGNNIVRRCTGELPSLANGGAIYGGHDNRIEDCLFRDISVGSGILLSTTFPTSDATADNNFSGTTAVENCRLERCGGFDHDWGWRGALEICVDARSIAGVRIGGLRITDSLSDAIRIRQSDFRPGRRSLSDTRIERVSVRGFGAGTRPSHGLAIGHDAQGSLTVSRSDIADIQNDTPGFQVVVLRGPAG
ncbi:MAG: glycosyl hydrolase family 28-related protein [Rhizomicrobium sp.]